MAVVCLFRLKKRIQDCSDPIAVHNRCESLVGREDERKTEQLKNIKGGGGIIVEF